jgi:predicted DNA-binding transcriptional regulator AlpA
MDKPNARITEERLVDSRDILKLIPIHRATLNAWIRAGQFPAPLKLPGSKRFWRRSTVLAWLDASDKHPAATKGTLRADRGSSKKRHR